MSREDRIAKLKADLADLKKDLQAFNESRGRGGHSEPLWRELNLGGAGGRGDAIPWTLHYPLPGSAGDTPFGFFSAGAADTAR